ncbi:MAG: AbrB/MazE/SpoVT family DNA-binding domain-containing protein [Turicibacter sp.]|nr:AbrB/MazE/SpoVT family DNA-binding domain-containing protein [Turicibacter sp.]
MELITIQENGQITIPPEIQQKLNLKKGNKIGLVEEDGGYRIINPTERIILEAQEAFSGVAEEMGWKTEEDVFEFCREFRRERSKNANNV